MHITRLEFLTRLLGWLSPCYAGGESEYNHAGSVRWRHDDLLLLLLPITAPTVNLSIAVGVSMVILYFTTVIYYLLLLLPARDVRSAGTPARVRTRIVDTLLILTYYIVTMMMILDFTTYA